MILRDLASLQAQVRDLDGLKVSRGLHHTRTRTQPHTSAMSPWKGLPVCAPNLSFLGNAPSDSSDAQRHPRLLGGVSICKG